MSKQKQPKTIETHLKVYTVVSVIIVTIALVSGLYSATIKDSTDNGCGCPQAIEPEHTYNRNEFGHGWKDFDHDGINTRNESLMLFNKSKTPTYNSDSTTIKQGRWVCPYSGRMFSNPRSLDIDHVVPLYEAWVSGAYMWTYDERVKFANDYEGIELLPVRARDNRSKGGDDPANWMPEVDSTLYLLRWVMIKYQNNLSMDSTESAYIIDYIKKHTR